MWLLQKSVLLRTGSKNQPFLATNWVVIGLHFLPIKPGSDFCNSHRSYASSLKKVQGLAVFVGDQTLYFN
ncbi:hypothetical protein SAMN05216167_11573 [Spirosoma endophyticum]|uniref:Uncharacterized protein n=1 Tax=Spirosoma endophyticum TaxID=662367 RepID=A0A1I2BDP5_9BACT|nr:hypothetical protein SAMN05216167_11573 [Spirosoma endophyticum]